jgi:murein L,D-transpeptidase YcbB/YkuD
MHLTRRKLLSSMATFGAAATFAPGIFAQEETDSLWDILARNRILRGTDTNENTAAALSAIDTNEPILSFDTANNLQFAIAYYEQIRAAGGWEPVPEEVFKLTLGKDGRGVEALRRRLMWTNDMEPEKRIGRSFDQKTDAGLRRFQARHGLLVTGQVDEPTYYALATPIDVRLNQLYLNAQRINAFAANLTEGRYVVVNIPAASIEAVEGGMVSQRHTAIVGRVERPTPILASKIHEINFNPYWNVPKSIIQRDLIKFMNDDPEYLTRYRIHIYDGNGNEIMPTEIDWTTEEAVQYQFRQEPGAENSMGHVKINFYNPHDVYLHDTPQKSLFGENARFHSSGCVRVEGVDELVAWLLRDNGGWDLNSVDAAFGSNERLDVAVSNPVPIHTTYISAWANRQGAVSFRDDVYQYDAAGKVTFES